MLRKQILSHTRSSVVMLRVMKDESQREQTLVRHVLSALPAQQTGSDAKPLPICHPDVKPITTCAASLIRPVDACDKRLSPPLRRMRKLKHTKSILI